MGMLGVSAVFFCGDPACVGRVFPNTIWNGLTALKGFPHYIYVNTADSPITIFTRSKSCCVVWRLAVSCCWRFA